MEEPKEKDPQEEVVEESAAGSDNMSELETARKAKDDISKELLYLRADFDNYKKRILREQDQMVKYANEKIISDLLPIIDLFEKALAHTGTLKARPDDKEVQNFLIGIEMTHKELANCLTRFGVEFTGTVGEKFDPARHEAVAQRPADDVEPGTVVDVAQRGCLLQGRILKPARVVVAEKKE